MDEKRNVPRHKSLLRGYVYFGGSPSAVDCTVRDFSDAGARLKFSGPPVASDNLTLSIPAKSQTFQARVVWQEGSDIGIAFADGATVGKASDTELSVRVERLEKEMDALKLQIKNLKKIVGGSPDSA